MFPAPRLPQKSVFQLYQMHALCCKKPAGKQRFYNGPYVRARFAAGRATALPWFALDSCHATSIGAAIAIEE